MKERKKSGGKGRGATGRRNDTPGAGGGDPTVGRYDAAKASAHPRKGDENLPGDRECEVQETAERPVRQHTPFPAAFVESLPGFPGLEDPRGLLAALDGDPEVSVRFNPFKVEQKPSGEPVPWNRYGRYLDSRPQFTLDPAHHAGAYYVQEAGSMFVEHIFRECMMPEGEEPGGEPLRVLDLCAAPGGKTTLLSTVVGPGGIVVANEPVRNRALTLADNAARWGVGNVLVTNNDPSHFEGFRDYFDFILVDAPCSGEGMFRKAPESRAQWSPENVKLCAARQRRILADVWPALKPGGVLLYSTCTFNRTENEDNAEWLAGEFGAEGAEVNLPAEWGVVRGEAGGIPVFRFYPHLLRSEGFFAAAARKPEAKMRSRAGKPRRSLFGRPEPREIKELRRWFGQPEYMQFATIGETVFAYYAPVFNEFKAVSEALSALYSGVEAGRLFNGRLRPAHPLALFHDVDRGAANEAPLSYDDAVAYLRKGDIDPELLVEGLNLACFDGLPLGWIKRIGNRSNNMLPKELRIVNL